MELQCALTEAQEQEYDEAVKLWQVRITSSFRLCHVYWGALG